MTNKVIVVSHRRSGTHLTIDTIINNFEVFKHNPDIFHVTLDHLSSHGEPLTFDLDDFKRRIDNVSCVLKTHSHGNVRDFFIGTSRLTEFIEKLFASSKIIYVHRDGRDVLVSLYHYHARFDKSIADMPFSDYIRMKNNFDRETYNGDMDRIEFWAFHVQAWMKRGNCLVLSFNDLKNDYAGTLNRISKFIEEPIRGNAQDVRRSSKSKLMTFYYKLTSKLFSKYTGVKYSSVGFRKGSSGEWKDYFSAEDLAFFNSKVGELNKVLGYQG